MGINLGKLQIDLIDATDNLKMAQHSKQVADIAYAECLEAHERARVALAVALYAG